MDGCLVVQLSFLDIDIPKDVISVVLEEITQTLYPVGTKYDFQKVKIVAAYRSHQFSHSKWQ